METKLYVGNLAYSATEDDLRKLFTQAGEVQSVNVIKDRDTGRSKGFAFVEMSTQAEAEKAISLLNGSSFHNRTLTVNLARPCRPPPRSRVRSSRGWYAELLETSRMGKRQEQESAQEVTTSGSGSTK
jgi:RNA recognition motif-containing protein